MHRLIFIALVTVAACKSGDDAKRAAAYSTHCKQDLATLKDKPEKMNRQSAVDSCGAACAKGDEASCPPMEAQVHELCALDHAWCETMCASDKNWPQVKKAACAIAKP